MISLDKEKIIFEGMTSVSALINASRSGKCRRKLDTVYFSSAKLKKEKGRYTFLKHAADELGFSLEIISVEEIDSLATGKTHGGILCVASHAQYPSLDSKKPDTSSGFSAIIEGVEDPYSLGYAARALYAAGADALILPDHLPSGADPVLCRASAGASELMDIFVCDSSVAADIYKEAGYKIACAEIKNSVPCNDADLKGNILLVIGGEKRGISASVLSKADLNIRIPYGRDFLGSLSTASATAILAYEVLRQR